MWQSHFDGASMNHLELLKKFILVAGEDSGQCQVLHVVEGFASLPFTDEEKAELLRLKDVAVREYLND